MVFDSKTERIARYSYQQLCSNKLDNLEETDIFLETSNLPIINLYEAETDQ